MRAKRNRPMTGGGIPASSSTAHSTPLPVVVARTTIVAGRSRERLELDVAHCPRCGLFHRHRAPVEWLGGVRTSPCGLRYVVQIAMPKRVAA